MNARVLAAIVAAPLNRIAVCGYTVGEVYDVIGVLVPASRKYTDETIRLLYTIDPEVKKQLAEIGLSISDAHELQIYAENYVLGDNSPDAQRARYNRIVDFAKYLVVSREEEAKRKGSEEEADLDSDAATDSESREGTTPIEGDDSSV